MAKNLRSKINADDSLIVYDVNTASTKRFMEEVGKSSSSTSIGTSVAEVAVNSVRRPQEPSRCPFVMSMFFPIFNDLSWRLSSTTSLLILHTHQSQSSEIFAFSLFSSL